jgi:hypothetical protein
MYEPEEIKLGSWRTENTTHEDMAATVDVIEIVKLQEAKNLRKYQDETRRWKNKKVKPRQIKEGDLVLSRVPKGRMKGKIVTPAFLPYSNYSTNHSLEKFFRQAQIAPKPLSSELLIAQSISRPFAV